jgi:CBS domain-containing protein
VNSLKNVENVMTPDPVSVSVDTYATKVRSIFRDDGFRCIPVISKNRLEGIISRGDIMNISSAKSNIHARGIMEHPKVIATPNMDISQIAKKLIKADSVQAPVVKSSDDMQLVGIISVVDILNEILNNGIKPKKEILEDITTKNVVTCNYNSYISKVWNKMNETGFSGLPVMKKGKIIGMITRKDIINSGHVRIVKESDDTKKAAKVENIMRTPPIVITFQNKVSDAAKLMIENDIGRLPVVENPVYIRKEHYRVKEAKLIGIITREDVLGSYLN